MTAVDERTSTDELEALDFEPRVPCDRPGHAKGEMGCNPDEPARWRVLVQHGGVKASDSCEPAQHIICDAGFRRSLELLSRQFHAPCIACGGAHVARIECPRCKATIVSVDELFRVIGEV